MDVITAVSYLLIAGMVGAWFWQLIRSTNHPINTALLLVSFIFGLLWPVMMPGVVGYRWLLNRGLVPA